MQIGDLALHRERELVTTRPDATVSSVAARLSENNIGAMLVCDADGQLVGIISERDIIRSLAGSDGEFGALTVDALMTTDVVTCEPSDDLDHAMAVMDEHGIRHLPVVVDGRLATIVSSRDILRALLTKTKTHAKTLALAYEMVR